MSGESVPDPDPRRSGRRQPVGLGIVVLAFAIVIAVGLVWVDVERRRPADPAGQNAIRGYACGHIGPATEDDNDYCSRAANDAFRRAPVSEWKREQYELLRRRLTHIVESARPCLHTGPNYCFEYHDPTPADAEAAKQALQADGFPTAVARIARPDDPARNGSLVFAVPIDDVCIVGHVTANEHRPGWTNVVGKLADGTCLPS